MSETQASVESSVAAPAAAASVADYIALLKPTVMSLAVFTAAVGMAAAPVHLHQVLAITALILIAMGAGAAGALDILYLFALFGALWVDHGFGLGRKGTKAFQ